MKKWKLDPRSTEMVTCLTTPVIWMTEEVVRGKLQRYLLLSFTSDRTLTMRHGA